MHRSTSDWTAKAVLDHLGALGTEENRQGMARFGIDASSAYGVPLSVLRPFSKELGKSPDLARDLWASGFHEARLLAILITPPKVMTAELALRWLDDVRTWDLCDQLTNVYARRQDSGTLVPVLAASEREFIKRAGFALIAWRAVHAKAAPDQEFLDCFELIRNASTDDRNFVWKAVHWALRQIGKRSADLYGPALSLGEELTRCENRTARKIGRETVNELSSQKVRGRLNID